MQTRDTLCVFYFILFFGACVCACVCVCLPLSVSNEIHGRQGTEAQTTRQNFQDSTEKVSRSRHVFRKLIPS